MKQGPPPLPSFNPSTDCPLSCRSLHTKAGNKSDTAVAAAVAAPGAQGHSPPRTWLGCQLSLHHNDVCSWWLRQPAARPGPPLRGGERERGVRRTAGHTQQPGRDNKIIRQRLWPLSASPQVPSQRKSPSALSGHRMCSNAPGHGLSSAPTPSQAVLHFITNKTLSGHPTGTRHGPQPHGAFTVHTRTQLFEAQ